MTHKPTRGDSAQDRARPVRGPALTALTALAAGIALAVLTGPVSAQTNSPLRGSATIGVRSVDVSGADTKYREDINLDDGARLFDLSLAYKPPGNSGLPVDELVFDAHNLGGDPFETVHFGARRYGAYNFKLDRRRSDYFYEDTIVPAALAVVTRSNAGDLHHFDFERVRDTASLDIDLSPDTRLTFDLERQTRSGESTTTLDVQRDEFELDKPLDETLDEFRVGIQHRFERVTLIVEEGLQTFDNTSEIFLPGASSGENSADPAELQFFTLNQAYDFDSRSHVVRVLAEPTDRIDIRGMYRSENLDMDQTAAEASAGTDFAGAPFTTDLTGAGAIGRDIEIADIEFGVGLTGKTRLVAGVRSGKLDQDGAAAFGADTNRGAWRIDTTGVEVGVEHALRPGLILAGGWSQESRDTDSARLFGGAAVAQRDDTSRDGFFVRLLFSGAEGVELSAAIEDNSIDDPYALASPTGSRRYRLSARRVWDNGFSVNGSFRRTDIENSLSAWFADTQQMDVRASYRADDFDVSFGLGNIEFDRGVDQLVTGGFRQDLFPIAYAADADFHDLSGNWSPSEKIVVGARLRDYSNRGTFRLDRDDLQLSLSWKLTDDYTLQAIYRDIDFTEDGFDDYDSQILEVGIRLSWL